MRKHIVAFAIAVGVLIIAVSVWIVLQSRTPTDLVAVTEPVVVSEPVAPSTKQSDSIVTPEPAGTVSDVTVSQPVEPVVVTSNGFSEQLAVATQALEAGDYALAEQQFVLAVRQDSNSIEALLGLAESQFQLARYDQASANLKAAEDLDATHPTVFILKGQIALKEAKFTEADQLFVKAGDKGAFWQGLMAAFFDRAESAQELLTTAVESDAVNAAAAKSLLAAYEKYLLFPDAPKIHIDTLLAQVFNQLGQYELAIAKIEPVLAANPDYRDAWILIGYAHLARAEADKARQDFSTAYNLDPAKPETAYFLGLTYIELGDYKEAKHYLILAKENRFEPQSELNRKLADVYHQQGDYKKAAKLYTEILSEPETTVTEFVRPVYLFLEKLDDGQKAWWAANLAMTRYPDSAQAYNLAGWVSLKNGYTEEGQNYLTQAIKLDPTLPGPYLNLGTYYETTNDLALARKNYKKAYDLDPDGPVGSLAAKDYNRLLETF